MARPLQLIHLAQEGRIDLGHVDSEEVVLGRDPPEGGVLLNSHAVSRHHGVLRGIGQQWFFLDQDSTNGSWLNGRKITPQEWKLVKPGDYLQLGDIALELAFADSHDTRVGAPTGIRSLIVFSRGRFLQEYPVPEFGRALVIGGAKADLRLDVDIHDLPSLVIERRGESVAAFTISGEVAVALNGEPLTRTSVLADRDELSVDHYRVIFNDMIVGANRRALEVRPVPSASQSASHVASSSKGKPTMEYHAELVEGTEVDLPQEEAAPPAARDATRSFPWAAEAGTDEGATVSAMPRAPERLPFGKIGVAQTVTLDSSAINSRISGYDIHPGSRNMIGVPEEDAMSSLEDKIWLGIGLIMVMALIIMVVWWILNKQ
jgi:pSer/pThr/pTyr-binding forkhead associated (FHA) protein